MPSWARFHPLVRKGLQFKRTFEAAKSTIGSTEFNWYPYDSFSNVFCMARLLTSAGLSLASIAGDDPIIDVGAGDGAMSFFLESLGYRVHALDSAQSNMNKMQGIRALARHLQSQAEITDTDVDRLPALPLNNGLALFLGTLYHLKNPYGVLEALARSARFCFLSTRIASRGVDRQTSIESMPVGWLLDQGECNGDDTNYWIFSFAGLERLVNRTGWSICSSLRTGASESDPVSSAGDQRAFLLLLSNRASS